MASRPSSSIRAGAIARGVLVLLLLSSSTAQSPNDGSEDSGTNGPIANDRPNGNRPNNGRPNNGQQSTLPAAFAYDSVADLPPCPLSLKQIEALGVDDANDGAPCLLADTLPDVEATLTVDASSNRTAVVTVVSAMERGCMVQTAGALTLVEQLNDSNGGLGAAIGYNRDHYVKFRLVTVLVGHVVGMGGRREYGRAHKQVLEDLITTYSPQYILGACRAFAENDKDMAGKHSTILLSTAGPQSFYQEESNEHVFGTFVPTETYGDAALRALRLAHPERASREQVPIRIIRADATALTHFTACTAVKDKAFAEGFADTAEIEYVARDDEDGDGVLNRWDDDHINKLADFACPPASRGNAVFICQASDRVLDNFIERFRENGCRPALLWGSNAREEWVQEESRDDASVYTNLDKAYGVMTDGQWHSSMDYEDEFFSSGQAMLDLLKQTYGLEPAEGAEALAHYHSIYLMHENVRAHFKTEDVPDLVGTFASKYEDLRRGMTNLFLESSLFGPTKFDADRRNVGRPAAGKQWLVTDGKVELMLVSPADQARVGVAYPAPASLSCEAGSFVSEAKALANPSVMESRCELCPVDAFQPGTNNDFSCRACPEGSGTDGATGATGCVAVEENLIPQGMLAFGYAMVCINGILAITFAIWTVYYRKDPVVTLGQKEFLLLLCFGSLLSSSSIIPLSFQAGILDDAAADAASKACVAAPWIYSTGWVMQYSSLLAKSYRMRQVMKAGAEMRRKTVTVKQTLLIVAVALLLNYCIVIPWTASDPLSWERVDLGVTVDDGVLTRETVGRCSSENLAAWLGSMFGYHLVIMIATNTILWKLRKVNDRYQESKYVTLASLFAFEFFLLGVPILLAVGDSSELRHLIFVIIIAFSDLGILLMVFVPKIRFQRKGLPENTTVVDSIMKSGNSRSGRSGDSQQSSRAGGTRCNICSAEMKVCAACVTCHPEAIPFIAAALESAREIPLAVVSESALPAVASSLPDISETEEQALPRNGEAIVGNGEDGSVQRN